LQDDDSLDVCNKGVTKQKEELTRIWKLATSLQ